MHTMPSRYTAIYIKLHINTVTYILCHYKQYSNIYSARGLPVERLHAPLPQPQTKGPPLLPLPQ